MATPGYTIRFTLNDRDAMELLARVWRRTPADALREALHQAVEREERRQKRQQKLVCDVLPSKELS